MQLVLDTNTVISGLLWEGPPNRIIRMAVADEITVFSSIQLLTELEDVLRRPKLSARIARIGSTPDELITTYRELVQIVDAPSLPAPVSVDPDDDAVLACAVAAGAQIVVSGDDDLLRLGQYAEILIYTATAFLAYSTIHDTQNDFENH